jgi:glycine cleavage system H protein
MKTPSNLKYQKTDEWVKMDGNIATIGISDYAQDQLSDIVFIEYLVSVGDEITRETEIASIESVKAAAEVLSPISGKVLEINEGLPDNPELINNDPFGEAWMFKIEASSPTELDQLMNADEYEKYCAERSH